MAREIEARRGKRFSDPRVQAQLDKEKWYYGDDKYTPARLSPTEKRNLELIERIRAHSASRKPKGQDPALDDRSGDAPVDERGEASRRDAAQEP